MKVASILTKVLMALTGLLWLGFLVGHLSGNLLLFSGPEVFNAYPVLLRKAGVLLYVVEAGLVVFLLLHIVSGIRLTLANRAARQNGYSVNQRLGKATIASRTMVIGGLIIAAFIPTHVYMLKFGDWGPNGDLWGLVIRTFSNPLMVAWYVLAMLALGLHLSHGFGSAFQTLGIFKPAWRQNLWKAGLAVGWAIAAGFTTMPIWAYWVSINQGS